MADSTTAKTAKIPGPDHPISVTPSTQRITVSLGGQVIADTREALTLREANYPPVYYIPRKDLDMAQFSRTEHASYCPYKGEAGYFSLAAAGARGVNAVWTYEAPYPAVASIAGHVAFYPDRVEIKELPLTS